MEPESLPRDVEYLRGLREAISRGVDYGIALLEEGVERGPKVPIALIVQARLAARQGIPLDVVIRRYFAAKTLLGDFIFEEAAAISSADPMLLRNVLAIHESAFDQLLSFASEEYKRERQSRNGSSESQLAYRVRRLLAGELVDPSLLDYDLDHHHLGIVAGGAEARQVIKQLATETDSRSLIISVNQEEVWAWLGRRRAFDPQTVSRLAASVSLSSGSIGLGEPTRLSNGWRLTHRQARAAFSVAKMSSTGLVRYADVAMVVTAAKDPVMTASLQELYLAPLHMGRDSGEGLRDTLRAYFSADRNSRAAAAALGVSRQTVANKLRQVEERVGQPLSACADLLDAALRMENLGFFQ